MTIDQEIKCPAGCVRVCNLDCTAGAGHACILDLHPACMGSIASHACWSTVGAQTMDFHPQEFHGNILT